MSPFFIWRLLPVCHTHAPHVLSFVFLFSFSSCHGSAWWFILDIVSARVCVRSRTKLMSAIFICPSNQHIGTTHHHLLVLFNAAMRTMLCSTVFGTFSTETIFCDSTFDPANDNRMNVFLFLPLESCRPEIRSISLIPDQTSFALPLPMIEYFFCTHFFRRTFDMDFVWFNAKRLIAHNRIRLKEQRESKEKKKRSKLIRNTAISVTIFHNSKLFRCDSIIIHINLVPFEYQNPKFEKPHQHTTYSVSRKHVPKKSVWTFFTTISLISQQFLNAPVSSAFRLAKHKQWRLRQHQQKK